MYVSLLPTNCTVLREDDYKKSPKHVIFSCMSIHVATAPLWARASPLSRLHDHTQTHDTTHNTHKRQTSVTPEGSKPSTSTSERPQTHALYRAAVKFGNSTYSYVITASLTHSPVCYSLSALPIDATWSHVELFSNKS